MNYEDLEELVNRSTQAQAVEDFSKAEILANEALIALDELFVSESKFKLLELSARANGTLGNIALYRSNYQLALEYYLTAHANYEVIDNREGIAAIFCSIANVFAGLSDYVKELEYIQKSFAIYEELGNKSGMARNLGNIGVVYRNFADYDKALNYYKQSLAIYEELSDKSGMARNLGNIGGIYWNLSDNDTALVYYRKALEINEKLGNKSSIAVNLSSIGIVYANFSDYTQSLEYFKKALAIFEELDRKSSIAINLVNIASLYGNTNNENYDAATSEELFLQAIGICQQIGAKQYQYTAHNYLASLYRKELRWEEADKNFQAFHTIKEDVLTEESKKQAQLMEHRRKIEESERDRQVKLARFQEQEKILYNILPAQIANRMIEGEKTIVDSYDSVSVLFADIVGFTKLSQRVTPEQLVAGLDGIFNTFDLLADKYGCEKIKTIGDCYMVVAGLPKRCDDHAERLGAMAIEMLKAIEEFPALVEDDLVSMRIGIHSGSVVAGIIGKNKYAYDLWGDAVNTASRMESHGEAGKIHCTEEFKNMTSESLFTFTNRGEMDIKGKGTMKTYFLEKV
ncbi:MAG: tetratricopeptide repeat protein [Bacteroidetes bacterium]|nr:tetratricopeptide repeat protein [Bacteroidota bacterium]